MESGLSSPLELQQRTSADVVLANKEPMGHGHHFDEVPEYERKKLEAASRNAKFPRVGLTKEIMLANLSRPPPKKKQRCK